MKCEAELIIEKATKQAKDALASVEEEIALWILKASALGEKQGAKQAAYSFEVIDKLQMQMDEKLPYQVLQTAYGIAVQMVEQEIKKNPQAIIGVAQGVLGTLRDVCEVQLRVHPFDAPVMRQEKQSLIDFLEHAKDIEIKEDAKVQRGGLLIHTPSGVIDAQPKSQLEEIASVLGV